MLTDLHEQIRLGRVINQGAAGTLYEARATRRGRARGAVR
jgi:hypothetical protein